MSAPNAAALIVAQTGIAAFFIAGVTRPALGQSAGLFVLAASLLAAGVRAIDIEGWAQLVPGGLVGRVGRTFGPRAATVATATVLVERLLLAALASLVIGHSIAATAIAGSRFTRYARPEDIATMLAVFAVGLLWVRARLGREIRREAMARGVWLGIAILLVATMSGAFALARSGVDLTRPLTWPASAVSSPGWPVVDIVLACIVGLALTLPVLGSSDTLGRSAHDFQPPRIAALRRVAFLTVGLALVITTVSTFLVTLLVPASETQLWANAPLAGLAQHLGGPVWLRDLVGIGVAVAAILVAFPAAYVGLGDAEQTLQRASAQGTLPPALTALHSRLGTPTRTVDATVAATILVIVTSGGHLTWLARAYAMAVAVLLMLSVGAIARLRSSQRSVTPYRTPGNFRFGARELPVGLVGPGVVAGVAFIVMVAVGDIPFITAGALIAGVALWLTVASRRRAIGPAVSDGAPFDLLAAADLSLDQVDARPGNVLVPVRNPHALEHVVAALQTPPDRDVVIMTARLIDVDVTEELAGTETPTANERQLLVKVVALAERAGRPVRLLIVPARSVFDAIVGAVVRLRSSDVYVGESATLSAADQARLLGDAWERIDKPETLDVRLAIYHRSGRADNYHLGAHPPSLTSGDLDLIHRLWLDAVKSVGPHVHHHDVVRAALNQMEHQLSGPNRDDAVAAIREVARPAEELAAVLRSRDYARLRDVLRNRHASDVADLLTALTLEDQVLVFRVLPRKDAAAVFEYLSQDAKEALLKAMAQDDVTALLNNMAPDDRTLFLEELPAEVTRQLLALLTPAERSVALTLLGYPEKSVGRLMTPHYVAVREHWTVREVLDYVRVHGEDSETLNVIYVLNDDGLLIDDVRIREFLLAPLEHRVTDLMDRRFVALKATDDQKAAVAVFRQYDRSALPVTDTAGMLIGIVTIDDVLDVAEATATSAIQRIGGSEALDEPYMDVSFPRMIQKRAGWLTALFLGEMLTATAMGAFEQEISRAVVLALFVPLIISSGGNSGSQASTLVIRALALGEVTVRDWWQVMRRELLAGLSLGAILGSIGFLRISVWSAFSDIYGPHWLLVAITVAVALVGVVLWGTLSGSLLPFALKRLGFDPAASSAPFVATLVDVTGLVIYFSVALVVLKGTLL